MLLILILDIGRGDFWGTFGVHSLETFINNMHAETAVHTWTALVRFRVRVMMGGTKTDLRCDSYFRVLLSFSFYFKKSLTAHMKKKAERCRREGVMAGRGCGTQQFRCFKNSNNILINTVSTITTK